MSLWLGFSFVINGLSVSVSVAFHSWVMDSLIKLELGIGGTFSIMVMDSLNRLVRFRHTFVIMGLLATLIFADMYDLCNSVRATFSVDGIDSEWV